MYENRLRLKLKMVEREEKDGEGSRMKKGQDEIGN